MNIIKRSGEEKVFEKEKIENSIIKANDTVSESEKMDSDEISLVVKRVCRAASSAGRALTVEEIQDLVEKNIMKTGKYEVAKNYVIYRYERSLARQQNTTDSSILSLVNRKNEDLKQENSNKNPVVISTMRDYMAGEVSKDITRRYILDPDLCKAHDEGIIHQHDMDYMLQNTFNCCLINLDDMLQNGTCISGTHIDKPHRFITACNIATQIIAQVASNQYGGQSISLGHLAPFVNDSRIAIRKEVEEEVSEVGGSLGMIDEIVERRLRKEIEAGVQTIQYQVITLMTTNGQAPFLTVFCYLNEVKDEQTKKDLAIVIEEVLRQRIKGVKNESGVYVTPAFPKIVYALEEDNVREGSRFWYLTKLAAECTAKRMVPDYVSEKVMLQNKIDKNGEGHCYTPMGCRSFLTPYAEFIDISGEENIVVEGKEFSSKELWDFISSENEVVGGKTIPSRTISFKHVSLNGSEAEYVIRRVEKKEDEYVVHASSSKYFGRFNQGVVTINLPYIALLAVEECGASNAIDKFWNILDKYLEMCHRGLKQRHERLEMQTSDISPIHWQYGALARLNKGESIAKLLHGGYSTISLGYAGLWECVYALNHKKLTEFEGEELGLRIMKKLNEYTAKWKEAESIDYSLYGTPIESTTYKFAKSLQRRFGRIEGVTDRNYITNSYHVHVTEEIDAFSKLSLESKFQTLSPGGAISYVEVPNMQDNIPAVLSVMQFIYDNIMYAELNTKSDYCHVCDYSGEIKIVKDENDKLVWECPKCGNRDQNKMNVARRTCGYIGSNFWNQGRTQEINERVLHL